MTLAVLIPAAGESSRLGQAKQLVDINGRPLLQDRIRLCSRAIEKFNGKVFCVLGANAHKIRHRVIDHRCRFLFFPNWKLGLAHTISFGISQLPKQITAVMILLADQWAINEQDLTQLIESWQQNPDKIHASDYQNIIGVPAIFPRRLFDELIKIDNQRDNKQGANQLIKKHAEQVISLPIAHAKTDLDTPEQLQQMQQQLNINTTLPTMENLDAQANN